MHEPSFNLIAIRVSDLEKARNFCEQLNLRFEIHQHGQGPQHYAAELDGFVFELYPRESNQSEFDPVRIGLAVDSIDAITAALTTGKVISPARESQWGRRMVLLDPDNNRVELLQRASPVPVEPDTQPAR